MDLCRTRASYEHTVPSDVSQNGTSRVNHPPIAWCKSGNVSHHKTSRRLAGRPTHAASLLFVWRPYPLISKSTVAPRNCCLHVPARWLTAFLTHFCVIATRTLEHNEYLGRGLSVVLRFDPSLWGLGGPLLENNEFVSWFASPKSHTHYNILVPDRGSCEDQQTWEWLRFVCGQSGGRTSEPSCRFGATASQLPHL